MPEATIQVIRAGVDVLVLSHITVNDATLPQEIIQAITGAVLRGDISIKDIEASYARIQQAKKYYRIVK